MKERYWEWRIFSYKRKKTQRLRIITILCLISVINHLQLPVNKESKDIKNPNNNDKITLNSSKASLSTSKTTSKEINNYNNNMNQTMEESLNIQVEHFNKNAQSSITRFKKARILRFLLIIIKSCQL